MNLTSIDLLSRYLKIEENIKDTEKKIKKQTREMTILKDKKARKFEKTECLKTFIIQSCLISVLSIVSLWKIGNLIPLLFLSITIMVPSLMFSTSSKLNGPDSDLRYMGIIPIIAPITICMSLFLLARYETQDIKIKNIIKKNHVDAKKDLDKKLSILFEKEEELIDMLIIDEEYLVIINNNKRYYQLKLKVEKILKERVSDQSIIDYYIQTKSNKNVIENY